MGDGYLLLMIFFILFSRSTKIMYGLSIALKIGLIVLGWPMVFTVSFLQLGAKVQKLIGADATVQHSECVTRNKSERSEYTSSVRIFIS